MIHVFSLNEITLARFLILALLRRRLFIIKVRPFVPYTRKLLQAVARWARSSRRAHSVVKLLPEMKPYNFYLRRLYFREAFKKYEPWQNRRFEFDAAENEDPDYGYGYKQITCSYVFFQNAFEAFVLDALNRAFPKGGYAVKGLHADTLALYKVYFGEKAPPSVSPMRFPNRLVNALLAVMAATYSIAWTGCRLRLSVPRENVFLAVDDMNMPCETPLFKRLSRYGTVLTVSRNAYFHGRRLSDRENYTSCIQTDGILGPDAWLGALWTIVRDTLFLWRRYGRRTTPHFFQIITMPHKRVVTRSLLNRFRPKYYWARDDYNTEHILRRQELRKTGGKSIGVSHAIYANWCSIAPNIRYISYDIYYVISDVYTSYYLDTWKQDMVVKSIGSMEITPEMLNPIARRNDDILVCIRVAWFETEMVRMVRRLAETFPQKKVYLQLKGAYFNDDEHDKFVAIILKDLPNIDYSTDPVFELLQRVRYHFSDISTIIQEGISLGANSFLADVIDMEWTVLRSYPGLCVKTGEEAVARIEAIESGRWTYPRKDYLARMQVPEGRSALDIVCDDFAAFEDGQSTPHVLDPVAEGAVT